MSELTAARLAELKAENVPHLDVSKMIIGNAKPVEVEAILAHFKVLADVFAQPVDGCLNCGRTQGGLLGAFSWGIRHGEGSCVCGWPARAHHFIELPDGRSLPILYILQYHPTKVLKMIAEDAAAEPG